MAVVEALPAASVALVREAAGGLDVFMMRRSPTMRFAPGMYVFPGGRLDPVDVITGAQIEGYPVDRDAARASAEPALLRSLVACAVRELGEESGVLVAPADLLLVDHWVTPEHSPMRYDVRFFAAEVPAGQEPRAVGTEMDEVRWIGVGTALEQARAGVLPMLVPALSVLGFLDACGSIAGLREAAGRRDVQPRLPRRGAGADDWDIVHAYHGHVLESGSTAHHFVEGGPHP